nr:uncharacterized protein LOC109784030 [Aegilops tauschii subsp. strangulata]
MAPLDPARACCDPTTGPLPGACSVFTTTLDGGTTKARSLRAGSSMAGVYPGAPAGIDSGAPAGVVSGAPAGIDPGAPPGAASPVRPSSARSATLFWGGVSMTISSTSESSTAGSGSRPSSTGGSMTVSVGSVSSSISRQVGSRAACSLASAGLAQAWAEVAASSSSALFQACQATHSLSAGSRPRSSSDVCSSRSMALLRVFQNENPPPNARPWPPMPSEEAT